MRIQINHQYITGVSNETRSADAMRQTFDRKCAFFLSGLRARGFAADMEAADPIHTSTDTAGVWGRSLLVTGDEPLPAALAVQEIEIQWLTQEQARLRIAISGFWDTLGVVLNVLNVGYALLRPSAGTGGLPQYALDRLTEIAFSLDILNSRIKEIAESLAQLPAVIAAALSANLIKSYFDDAAGAVEGAQIWIGNSEWKTALDESVEGFKSLRKAWNRIEQESGSPPGFSGLTALMPTISELSQAFATGNRMYRPGDPCRAPTIHSVPINATLVREHDRVADVIVQERKKLEADLRLTFPWQNQPTAPFAPAPLGSDCYDFDDVTGFSFFERVPPLPPPDPLLENKYFGVIVDGVLTFLVFGITRTVGTYHMGLWTIGQIQAPDFPPNVDKARFRRAHDHAARIAPAHDWQQRIGLLAPRLDELRISVDTKMRKLPDDWCQPVMDGKPS